MPLHTLLVQISKNNGTKTLPSKVSNAVMCTRTLEAILYVCYHTFGILTPAHCVLRVMFRVSPAGLIKESVICGALCMRNMMRTVKKSSAYFFQPHLFTLEADPNIWAEDRIVLLINIGHLVPYKAC